MNTAALCGSVEDQLLTDPKAKYHKLLWKFEGWGSQKEDWAMIPQLGGDTPTFRSRASSLEFACFLFPRRTSFLRSIGTHDEATTT